MSVFSYFYWTSEFKCLRLIATANSSVRSRLEHKKISCPEDKGNVKGSSGKGRLWDPSGQGETGRDWPEAMHSRPVSQPRNFALATCPKAEGSESALRRMTEIERERGPGQVGGKGGRRVAGHDPEGKLQSPSFNLSAESWPWTLHIHVVLEITRDNNRWPNGPCKGLFRKAGY